MARSTGPKAAPRKSTKAATEATESPVTEAAEAPIEATKEATVSDTATVETPTEATDTAKPEIDLTAFNAAVDAALAERDLATGTLTPSVIEPVKTEYRNLDGVKAKNAAKKNLAERLSSAVDALDVVTGKAVMILQNEMQSAGGGGKAAAERTPVDPTEAFTQKLAVINLAYNLVASDVPEGVNEDEARGKVTTLVEENDEAARSYMEYLAKPESERGDEPEVSALVKKAVKVALGRGVGSVKSGSSTSHEGPRGNIARHIQLALAEQPDGTFMKVSEIAKARTEEYPNGTASAGAVSSRLKSPSPIEGVEAGTNADGRFGAYKRG